MYRLRRWKMQSVTIMLKTSKSERVIEMPSDEENERINAGIAKDDDTYELSRDEFSQLKNIKRKEHEQ